MSLTTCPECNEKVSDMAKACPHCGALPAHEVIGSSLSRAGCLLTLFGFGFLFMLAMCGCDTAPNTTDTSETFIFELHRDSVALVGSRVRSVRVPFEVPAITQNVLDRGDVFTSWRGENGNTWYPLPMDHGTGTLSYTYTLGTVTVEKEDTVNITRQTVPHGLIKITVIDP